MSGAAAIGAEPSLRARMAGQGALLFGGYALAQALSFARNAILAHALSKGDFGVAATLTMMLQLADVLTDLGADRIIVQDKDGGDPRLAATIQGVHVLRGLVTALVLVACAPLLAAFFAVPDAAPAFAATAIVPLVRGFLHLDLRLAQRHLDNRPQMAAEVVPQLAALLLLWPLLVWQGDYGVVIWLAAVQAALMVAISHVLAGRSYRLALDRELLGRIVKFGWPIWAAAIPVIAVYQGDRIIVGRLLGMEALAGYSVAFMATMVPALLSYKVGNALMLPLLARTDRASPSYPARYAALGELTALCAGLYLTGFVVAGGAVLPVVFGAKYSGLGAVVGWLALMWSVRMLQAVPSMSLMASGETRPLLVGGIIRAAALAPALALLWSGFGLVELAAAGTAGEVASLVYLARATRRVAPGLEASLLARSAFLLPVGLLALGATAALPRELPLAEAALAAALSGALTLALAVLAMPKLRAMARETLARRIKVFRRS